MGRKSESGSGIRDEQPGSYFLELKNHFFVCLGLKYLHSLTGSGIRDGDSSDPGSGMEKSRIRDKHPGSAILGTWCKIPSPNTTVHSSHPRYLATAVPDPDSDFLPIPDPGLGSRGQKGTGSWIRIRNTGFLYCSDSLFSLLLLIDSFILFTSQSAIAGGTAQVPAAGGSAQVATDCETAQITAAGGSAEVSTEGRRSQMSAAGGLCQGSSSWRVIPGSNSRRVSPGSYSRRVSPGSNSRRHSPGNSRRRVRAGSNRRPM